MQKKYYAKPVKQQKIAKERIKFLFQLAKESFKDNSKLADNYARLARRIAMKFRIRLSAELKKKICKNCHRFLVPGVNCRVRLHKHRVIYYCIACRHYMRHPVR